MRAASRFQYPHFASVTYVVMPTTGRGVACDADLKTRGSPARSSALPDSPARFELTSSATFEHPLPLVARHGLVEQLLLGAGVVQVVVDDVVAEDLPRDAALLQTGDRLAQRVREPLGVGNVRVALQRRPELKAVLDPVEPGAEEGSECEVRVSVRTRDSRLRAKRRSRADDAEAARAVVVAPRERGRRPAPGGETLVRVDRRRDEHRKVCGAGDLSGEVALEDVRLARERRHPAPPQRRVDVTRGADPAVVRL